MEDKELFIPALVITPYHQPNTHVFADGHKNISDIFNNYVSGALHGNFVSRALQGNFVMLLFITYLVDHNEILHMSQQSHCCDMCKILL